MDAKRLLATAHTQKVLPFSLVLSNQSNCETYESRMNWKKNPKRFLITRETGQAFTGIRFESFKLCPSQQQVFLPPFILVSTLICAVTFIKFNHCLFISNRISTPFQQRRITPGRTNTIESQYTCPVTTIILPTPSTNELIV